MPSIQIDTSLCSGDTLCVQVCPAKCLRMKNGKAATVPLGENLCIRCGQCVAICPKAAIRVNNVNLDNLPKARADMDAERFALFAKSRRSIRNFKDKPVPPEVILDALETARYAPTGSNRQDVEWIVWNDRDKLHDFAAKIIDAMRGMEGQERLVSAFDKGDDVIFRGAPCAVFNHSGGNYSFSGADCAIAITYLELMLHSMGMGSCWAGYALRMAQMVPSLRDYLGLPSDRQIHGGLMVGYPSFRYQRLPERKPLRVIWA